MKIKILSAKIETIITHEGKEIEVHRKKSTYTRVQRVKLKIPKVIYRYKISSKTLLRKNGVYISDSDKFYGIGESEMRTFPMEYVESIPLPKELLEVKSYFSPPLKDGRL